MKSKLERELEEVRIISLESKRKEEYRVVMDRRNEIRRVTEGYRIYRKKQK